MEQNTTNGDENNNVISWTHSPGGGSASWSAGCSNERVSSISKEKTTTGWTSSWSKMGKSLVNVQPPYRIVSVKKKKSRPYFVLKIFIDSTENYDLYKKYVGAVKQHNNIVSQYKSGGEGSVYFDAGFDLFCPETIVISDSRTGALVHKLNHMVKCSMMKVDVDADGEEFRAPVGYYMYPRSSTGTKPRFVWRIQLVLLIPDTAVTLLQHLMHHHLLVALAAHTRWMHFSGWCKFARLI